jgi:hypothetical protein
MNEEKDAGNAAQEFIVLKKEIVPFEKEGPEEEPLFINHCQLAFHAGSVYIDVGIIPLDEVAVPMMPISATPPKPPSEVRFLVLNRLVMSGTALGNLKSQIDELFARMEQSDAQTKQAFYGSLTVAKPTIPEKTPIGGAQ